MEILTEDYQKSERLGPRAFIAYMGQFGQFYERVLGVIQDNLKRRGGELELSGIAEELLDLDL